jgi:hypothetical protein
MILSINLSEAEDQLDERSASLAAEDPAQQSTASFR